jgi:hypothetical protein
MLWSDGTKSPRETKDCRDARPTASVPVPAPSARPAIVTRTADGSTRCAPDFAYHNYKQYKTTGSPWGDDKIHPTYADFGNSGCHITVGAVVLEYYGKDLDPPALRDKLNEMNGWRASNAKSHPADWALRTLMGASRWVEVEGKVVNNESSPKVLEAIRSHFCVEKNGAPMIGNVDYDSDADGGGNHFVPVLGVQVSPSGKIDPLVFDVGSADGGAGREGRIANQKTKDFVLLSNVRRRGGYNLRAVEYGAD